MDERRKSGPGERASPKRLLTLAASAGLAMLTGCTEPAGTGGARVVDDAFAADTVASDEAAASGEAAPMTTLGAFLAGRVAQDEQDYGTALGFYRDALAHNPTSSELANRVLVLAVAEGHFDIAEPVAAKLAEADPDNSGLAQLVRLVESVKSGDRDNAVEAARHLPKEGFYRLAGSLTRAWTLAMDPAKTSEAVAELDELAQIQPLAPLKALHTALLLDLAGNTEAAAQAYQAALGTDGKAPLRMVQLVGNFLEREGHADQAETLYQAYTSETAGAFGVRLTVSPGGNKPPRIIPDARHGLAESLYDMASLIGQSDSPEVAMLSVRLALELEPRFPLAQLVLGDALESEHRLPEALAVYRSVDRASPLAWTARLREAVIRDETGETQAAEADLAAMAQERENRPEPLIELGDIERAHEDYAKAAQTYSAALARIGGELPARDWSILFSRGIAEERSGAWKEAEADLRKALALRPNEPAVLNYLGYSLVDRNERLPEALKLIKEAVDLRPTDGFIVDSLGWAYYRLGDYKNAETTLERAVELEPADAEITNHLGDAYWQGGRRAEARLQWRRALDLKPATDLAKSIEVKLDHPPKIRRPARAAPPASAPGAAPSHGS